MPEVIDLITDDDSELYIRGHIQHPALEALAIEAAHSYALERWGRSATYRIDRIGYARWGVASPDADYDRALYLSSRGRGAFPITILVSLAEIERQAREAAWGAQLEAWVRAWLPEATEIDAHTYPIGEGSVHFRLPEFQGPVSICCVRAQPTGWMTWVRRQDLDAWSEYYADRVRPPVPIPAV